MKKINTSTKNMTTSQKELARRKAKEAKARRKINEDWQRVESTCKYLKAATKSIGRSTTDKIAEEVLDGILLSFNKRNSDKSVSEQKRLLRRIVEKRQAQALHDKTRNGRDRKSSVAVITNTSRCIERLNYLRFVC